MAIWADYLNAAKSGTDAGLALARILNDKQQAAEKLSLAQDSEANQNALGYASLAAKERESAQSGGENQQMAAAKLAAAQEQNLALQDYRQQSLDQRSSASDELNKYRTDKLGETKQRHADLLSLGQQNLAKSYAWLSDKATSRTAKMSDVDKAAMSNAMSKQSAALKALTQSFGDTASPGYILASKTLTDSQAEIDAIQSKYGGVSSQPAPAGTTTMTSPSAAEQLTGSTPLSLGGGVTIGGPATTTGAAPSTSAADALTSGTSTGSLSATPTASPATPKTKKEYDALSSGDSYVNPSDGKTYIKE